jgi:uncharacterized protein
MQKTKLDLVKQNGLFVMISETDIKKIIELSKKYNAKRVLLFGSATGSSDNNRDIDLAVEGVADNLFFKYFGELIFNLSRPVDLVDLGRKSKFSSIISSEGIQLYG